MDKIGMGFKKERELGSSPLCPYRIHFVRMDRSKMGCCGRRVMFSTLGVAEGFLNWEQHKFASMSGQKHVGHPVWLCFDPRELKLTDEKVLSELRGRRSQPGGLCCLSNIFTLVAKVPCFLRHTRRKALT